MIQVIPITNKSLSKRLTIKSLFILTGSSRTQVEIDPVKFEFHLLLTYARNSLWSYQLIRFFPLS